MQSDGIRKNQFVLARDLFFLTDLNPYAEATLVRDNACCYLH